MFKEMRQAWVVAILLAALGLAGLGIGNWLGWDDGFVGAWSGSLFGAAAVLVGVLVDHGIQREREALLASERVQNIKSLIAAELMNVLPGAIDANEFVRAALETLRAGGPVPEKEDLSGIMPRPMPVTDSITIDLLSLPSADIRSLMLLRGNLATTARTMSEFTAGKRMFRLLGVTALMGAVIQDLRHLALAFRHFDPDRQVKLSDDPATLVTVLLNELADQGERLLNPN